MGTSRTPMKYLRLASVFLTLVLLLMGAAGSLSLAQSTSLVSADNMPEPAYATANIDGDSSECDLCNSFFANMYRAEDPTKTELTIFGPPQPPHLEGACAWMIRRD